MENMYEQMWNFGKEIQTIKMRQMEMKEIKKPTVSENNSNQWEWWSRGLSADWI